MKGVAHLTEGALLPKGFRMRSYFSKDDGEVTFRLLKDGKVAGHIVCLAMRESGLKEKCREDVQKVREMVGRSDLKLYHVYNSAIEEEHQGQGVGSAMYAFMVEEIGKRKGMLVADLCSTIGITSKAAQAMWTNSSKMKSVAFVSGFAAASRKLASASDDELKSEQDMILMKRVWNQMPSYMRTRGEMVAWAKNARISEDQVDRFLKNKKVQPELKVIRSEGVQPYHSGHMAPMKGDGAPLWDVTHEETYPKDFYEGKAREYAYSDEDGAALGTVLAFHLKPNKSLKVYRAVAKDTPKATLKINRGDWVTLNRRYAVEHGRSNLRNEYKIITKTVYARDLYTEGNSLQEWGYDPQPALAPSDYLSDDQIAARKEASAKKLEADKKMSQEKVREWLQKHLVKQRDGEAEVVVASYEDKPRYFDTVYPSVEDAKAQAPKGYKLFKVKIPVLGLKYSRTDGKIRVAYVDELKDFELVKESSRNLGFIMECATDLMNENDYPRNTFKPRFANPVAIKNGSVTGHEKDGAFYIEYLMASERGVGNGRKALEELGKKYDTLYALDPIDEARGFWEKMMKEGLVKDIFFTMDLGDGEMLVPVSDVDEYQYYGEASNATRLHIPLDSVSNVRGSVTEMSFFVPGTRTQVGSAYLLSGELQGIQVFEQYRRKGYGTAIMRDLSDQGLVVDRL